MPEFGVQALDSLRGPLETGEVMVARANAHIRYPAKVQLVAAMNPCRCGHGGAGRGYCGKAPRCQRDYQGRVSGPLMDRIDLAVDMPAVTAADLSLPPPAEGLNGRAEGAFLEQIAALDDQGRSLLARAAEAGRISARGWTRVLRLSRTIADLEGADGVKRVHVAEALAHRRTTTADASLQEGVGLTAR
jgi:magnesium chelatase family protein